LISTFKKAIRHIFLEKESKKDIPGGKKEKGLLLSQQT